MTEQEEMRQILTSPKAPSLKQLIEEHGLICGHDGELYFGKDAEDKARGVFTRDEQVS